MLDGPARVTLESAQDDLRHHVLGLLRDHGWNSTSFQVLEPEFSYWFADGGCVAYVDTGRAWVAAGAPIAADDALAELGTGLVEAARARKRRAVFFGIEDRFLERTGMDGLRIGEQPVWEPGRWRQTLRSSRSLREQLRRARAKGIRVRRLGSEEVADEALRLELAHLFQRWQGGRPLAPMGFLVALHPFSFSDERRYFVAERDQEILGFLAMVPVYARDGWLLEDFVRDPHAPNGTMELLVHCALERAAAEGSGYATLGLAPLAGNVPAWLRLVRDACTPLYDFHGLRAFKAKLRPHRWDAVHLALPRGSSRALGILDVLTAFSRVGLIRFGLGTLARNRRWMRLAAIALAACAVALVALCSGCSKPAPPERGPAPTASAPASARPAARTPPAAPPERTYNVLFVLVDSLRADMPWTGYPRPIAPWLTKFAKRATLYPRAYSLSSYTAKSVAPALVGKYPSAMARDGYFFTKWLPSNVFISERAQAAGHRTLAGHGHGYFLRRIGMDQGFDDYRLLPGTFLDVTGVHDVTSERLNTLAKEMLSDPKNVRLPAGKRFFAYFHFLDPHYSYLRHDGHPDFGQGRRDLYDNEVHYTDRWVGDLVDWALAQPWGKDTAVVISADHGEGFGERGHFRHAYELWESLVRVPLFVYVPGAEPRRIEVPRSHIDLAPTIADLLGIALEPAPEGKSLLPEVFGAPAAARPVIVDLPRSDLMDRRRALIDGDLKLVALGDDARFLLFDVARDPKEEHDLAESRPTDLAKMKALYAELSQRIPNQPVVGGVALKGAPPDRRW